MSWKEQFLSLSKSERYGMWLLLVFVSIFLICSALINRKGYENPECDFSEFEKNINTWEAEIADNDNSRKEYNLNLDNPAKSTAKSKLNPFEFDPNKLESAEWKKLGLNDGQIKSIMKFRTKGGAFKYKEDFSKMYVISKIEYDILEPYILLPNKGVKQNNKKQIVKTNNETVSIELNGADSVSLRKVKGIGQTFAKRIIRYRDRLGGFTNINQLLEVKGIDSTNFPNISAQVFVNPYSVRKIRINKADINDLKKHPYISYNIALSLINYRKHHGDFQEISDLKKSMLVTDEIYNKISPYITVK